MVFFVITESQSVFSTVCFSFSSSVARTTPAEGHWCWLTQAVGSGSTWPQMTVFSLCLWLLQRHLQQSLPPMALAFSRSNENLCTQWEMCASTLTSPWRQTCHSSRLHVEKQWLPLLMSACRQSSCRCHWGALKYCCQLLRLHTRCQTKISVSVTQQY